MGALKQAMLNVEDLALDAAKEQAAESYYLFQDFMHEQRDMIREAMEISILDALGDMTDYDEFDMDNFWEYMGFKDEDDYHCWLDETACEALAEEGMHE